MFRAIGRWFRSIGYLFTGRIDSSRRAIDTDPKAIQAKYDRIVRDKIDQIQSFKTAVAGLITQQTTKMAKLKLLTNDVEKLERLKAGALAKAKQTVKKLQDAGKPKEDIHQNEDYQRCLTAFNDFASTLQEKQDHIEDLEKDIEQYAKSISDHKLQLRQLLRDVEKLKTEAKDTVAEIITAKQERELADTLSGIANDSSAEALQELRQTRDQAKAEARVSKEVAGLESKAQEAEFLDYARNLTDNTEFDELIGLAEKVESEAPEPELELESEAGAEAASEEKKSSLPE